MTVTALKSVHKPMVPSPRGVGGAFASGMDARELEDFIASLDWHQLFRREVTTWRPSPFACDIIPAYENG